MMIKRHPLPPGILAVMLALGLSGAALAQEPRKPDPDPKRSEGEAGDGVREYCANIAGTAADARIAWQMKRLGELQAQMKQQIAELEAKEAEAKEWIDKREAFMKKAEDGVVAIYAKMDPEAAAAQLVVMDDAMAAALLSKLNPRVSSAILNEMDAARAAKLTDMMAGPGAGAADRKKS